MTHRAATPSGAPSRESARAAAEGLVETAARPGPQRAWQAAALIAPVVALAMNGYIALGAVTPSFPFDEVTLLQYAKYFAQGGGEITPVEGAGYFPGWSILIAPLWWVTSSPSTFYAAAIWIGVAVAVLTIWPLAAIVCRFGGSPQQAVVVGSIVMSMPSRTVQSDYTMSEKPLFLAVALLMLGAIRLWERPTALRAAVFAVLAVLTGFMHSRATVLLIACVIWLLLFVLRSWKASLVGLVLVVPLGWLTYRYSMQLNVDLLQGSFKQGLNLAENLATARPSIIVRVILGQSWNQTVATLGIFLIGVVVVLWLIWTELRRDRAVGPASLLGGMFLGIFFVSVASWSNENSLYLAEWRRLDSWIYGRYMEPVTALIVAAGLAALLRGLRASVVAIAASAALAIILPTVFWVAPDAPTWGYVTPAHIGGVMPWSGLLPDADVFTWTWGLVPTLTNANRFWAVASLTTLIALAALGILTSRIGRRVPTVTIAGVLLLAAAVGSVASDPATDDFQAREGGVPSIAVEVRSIEDAYGSQKIDYDRTCKPPYVNNAVVQNYVAYWILPSTMETVFDPAEYDADIVLSCGDWPQADKLGAVATDGELSNGYRVWIMPGTLQDEMIADGQLAEPAAG